MALASPIIQTELENLRNMNVGTGSRAGYERSSGHFILWLDRHKPHLIPEAFRQASQSPSLTWSFIRESIQRHDPGLPPIHFDEVSADDFLEWIITLRKVDGEKPSYSMLNGHRSALKNLYRDYRKTLNPDVNTELSTHFKGLKRQRASEAQAGQGRAKVGKDPLSFSLYNALTTLMLKQKDKKYVLAHAIQVLSWNLMCRARNGIAICKNHLGWHEDAMTVLFANQKNDQLGERRDPRHIYADALLPSICPVLSLAIYLSVYPFHTSEEQLFSGVKQYDRYRKIMASFYELDEVRDLLVEHGVDPTDLGTHSTRKGSVTYATSGTTAAPPTSAVHLRAGWVMPGVTGTYMRYESAGDQFVGRVVSGLPPNSPLFALLPPFFRESNTLVSDSVKQVFPNIPNSRIGAFCLASLVYHRDYLRETLPREHPLFTNILWTSSAMLSQLSQIVDCRLFKTGDPISATGIPPHVSILVEVREAAEELKKIPAQLTELGTSIVSSVITELNDRALQAHAVTPSQLSHVLEAHFARISERIEQLRGGDVPRVDPASNQSGSSLPSHSPSYVWGGQFHQLPEDFRLPKGTPQTALSFWCLGSPSAGIPPLRLVNPSDFSRKQSRRRFSDFKFLVKAMEQAIGNLPTSETVETQDIFMRAEEAIVNQIHTPSKKRTRPLQRDWQTAVKQLRSTARQRTA